jgi:aspartyl-tRNA(Asn)/glutamyl-tRNA(Gln) amidotransferase subunit C
MEPMPQVPQQSRPPISADDVKKVGELARLNLESTSLPALAQQLSAVLDYFAQLDQVSTDGVEPLAHVGDLTNVFAEDCIRPSLSREAALGNAPQRDEAFFRVPPVI